MAGNVVNLNRFRKKKAREEQAKRADTNRRLHGRTGAEKERERIERERTARTLDGKRLESAPAPTSDGTVIPFVEGSAPTEPPHVLEGDE
jgi:hypothetical protein